MRAGQLRHKVVIQENVPSRDGYGAEVESWDEYATVWAAIEPIRGREFWESQQINAEVTARITIRYLAGVTPKMRILHGTRIFEILSVINPEERNRELQLMVKENVET
jgi:SPP1 family predicted phage head-tail adaptor